MSKGLVATFLLALSIVLEGLAFAQSSPNGAIRGYAKDEQNAVLPGVVVSATTADAPGAYSAVTDTEGYYRLLDLPPGSYAVRAELQGFSKTARDGILVRAGLTLLVDLVLKIGNVTETVDVRAETSLLEATRPVNSLNVSGALQRDLPLSARQHFYDFLQLTPATVSAESAISNDYYVNGSQSHVFQLDGADMAPAVSNRTVYLFGSSSIVQDVQVTTSGIEASTPLGTGAIVNLVTRSGSNNYTGGAGFVFQPQSWNGNNNPSGTTASFSLVQPEATLGGPIARNHAWVFGNVRYAHIEQSVARSGSQLAALQALKPGFEPFANSDTSNQFFIKPTIQLGPNQRLQFFEQYGLDKQQSGGSQDAEAFLRFEIGGHANSIRLDSVWNPAFTTRSAIAYSNQSYPNYTKYDDRPGRPVYQSVFASGGGLAGNTVLGNFDNYRFPPTYTVPESKLTVTIDSNYHTTSGIGSHDVQFGLYLQPKRSLETIYQYQNNGFVLEEMVLKDPNNVAGGYVPFHRRTYDGTQTTINSTNSEDYAAYLQDQWHASERVTVSAGMRVDKIRRTDRIFGDRIQDTVAFGPRLGINYALTADRRNTLRATAGIIHDSVSNGTQTTAGSASGGYTDFYDVNLDGVFETRFQTAAVTQRTLNRVIDIENYRQPHAVDLTAGYARQLPGRITFDLSLLRREFKDRSATVDINGIYNGNVFAGYIDPNFTTINKLTSNTYNWPVYTSLTAQMAREGTRWQLVADYTRQFRHIEGSWQPHDPASFIQPDAFVNDKGIGSVGTTTANSLSGGAYAGYQQWQDHVVRAALNVRIPGGVLVSTGYSFQSGQWSGPIVTRLAAPDPQFGPATVTLSNGKVVSNPLATPIRFAYATMGAGQFHLDGVHVLNLRVGKEVRVSRQRIQAAIQLLNVLNNSGDYSFADGANQLYSTNFGKGQGNLQSPRSAQAILRLEF
jgi:hypothetical protein